MLEPARWMARRVLNEIAKRRVERAAQISVAPSARINYRRIKIPPARMIVLEDSIIDSDIYSYRPDSVLSVGARSFLGGAEVHCASSITIEDDVLIAWGCMLMDHNAHSTSRAERRNDVTNVIAGRDKDWSGVRIGPIRVRSGAWICARSIVLRGVTIGEGAIVAAGSVVVRDVPSYAVVAGNPAEVIRTLSDDQGAIAGRCTTATS